MDYFCNYLKQYKDKIVDIYVDMDGVVADYDVLGYEYLKEKDDVYLNKRPVMSSIKSLENVSKMDNVNIFILSVARKESQISGKVEWLKKNMSFIKLENINIIPRDTNNFEKAHNLKKHFLEHNTNKDHITIMVDDSHQVLDAIFNLDIGIIPLHITSIID